MTNFSNLRLVKGDHIRVKRTVYYHHGIYCGHNEVIHYFVERGCGIVSRHSLANFSKNKAIEVTRYDGFNPNEIVKRAESRLREKKYHLLFNNCEHFAYWCRTGQAKSSQIELVFNIIEATTNPSMYLFSVAEGIYRLYKNEKEKSASPEHLPKHILILFQRFKRAYESKNIAELKDTISRDFEGDLYGSNKSQFISMMSGNFRYLKYGTSPYIVIEVHNICHSDDTNFAAIIKMKANIQFLGILTPIKWDADKLYIEAKTEGDFNYWRISKIAKFAE